MTRPATHEETVWMKRALRLAARGYTHPNPMVGCVVVKDGQIVGEGFHRLAGEAHAEVNALLTAGERARGATAYVSLEPCSHHGRTPPCVQALIQAGVARVFAAVIDPDVRVSGRSVEELRKAGTAVEVGLLEHEARALNEAYFHHRLTGRPFVILKAAMSLDGKIATHTGESKWISGEKARTFVHRLRARCGAVLCGINTVLDDDPLLTSRYRGAPRQPLRIVLDTHLRLPVGSHIARTAKSVPTLIVTGDAVDAEKRRTMEQERMEILPISADKQNRIPLAPLLDELGRRGITSLLVEGGAEIHASFLCGQFAQRLLWIIAPKVIGGRGAPGPVGGQGARAVSDALQAGRLRVRRIAEDLLVETTPNY